MIHELKIAAPFANAIMEGRKNFELRVNDRGYQADDKVRFFAVEDSMSISHPINGKFYEITYVMSGYGLRDGYVAFGIKELEDDDRR